MDQQNQITFSTIYNENTQFELLPELRLLFGLHGRTRIQGVQQSSYIEEGGVYVVSPLALHRICSENCAAVLSLTVSEELLHLAGWTADTTVFCHIADAQSKDALHYELRRRYAVLFRTFFQAADNSAAVGQALSLVTFLKEHFSSRCAVVISGRAATLARFEGILRRIQQRWQEPLTLQDIAAEAFLTPNYLSRLFQKQLGMTFTDYLVSLRLEHAARALRETDCSVTQIAYEHGFKNVNSFIEYFRKGYGITPGKFRSTQMVNSPFAAPGNVADWMQVLLQYADSGPSEHQPEPTALRRAVVNASGSGIPLKHNWRQLVNIGYARDGLIGTVQQQLRRAQQEIGFTYLRFHGIFDEDMHIYQEHADGSPWFNFTYADLLFDFVLSVGLTPFVELSFMPEPLAKQRYQLFDRRSVNSMYNDASKWEALVQATVAHWIERYGLSAVLQWNWSIVSINYAFLHEVPMTYDEYIELYLTTYRTLKTLDHRLQFGGPGGFANAVLRSGWITRFLEDVTAAGCPPDFLTAQCYPHEDIFGDSEFLYFTSNQTSAPSVLSKNESFTEHFLRDFRAVAQSYGLGDRKLILEEWAATLWQRDLSGDTCYKAAWLFKNVLENYDSADMFGYWLLTDFIEEWVALGGVFHGGYGLFTASGVPKAGYQAMRLLCCVGDERIDAGPGWFVTRDISGIQIFLYHYCHYDGLYRYRYTKLRDPKDAYKVFEDKGNLQIELTLCGLQAGNYRQETRILNRAAGSSFDRWIEMGAPASMRPEDLRYLTDAALPAFEIREKNIIDTLDVQAMLQPHEVRVIRLQKRDC